LSFPAQSVVVLLAAVLIQSSDMVPFLLSLAGKKWPLHGNDPTSEYSFTTLFLAYFLPPSLFCPTRSSTVFCLRCLYLLFDCLLLISSFYPQTFFFLPRCWRSWFTFSQGLYSLLDILSFTACFSLSAQDCWDSSPTLLPSTPDFSSSLASSEQVLRSKIHVSFPLAVFTLHHF